MPSPRLNEMLAEYRRLRSAESRWSAVAQRQATEIVEYLLTVDASDLDERDRTFSRPPILPTMDVRRRAEDIKARAGE